MIVYLICCTICIIVQVLRFNSKQALVCGEPEKTKVVFNNAMYLKQVALLINRKFCRFPVFHQIKTFVISTCPYFIAFGIDAPYVAFRHTVNFFY